MHLIFYRYGNEVRIKLKHKHLIFNFSNDVERLEEYLKNDTYDVYSKKSQMEE
jgi:hypothetical protein